MNDYITIRNLDEARRHIASSKNPILFVVEEGTVNFCGLVIDGTFGYRVGNRQPNIERMIRDFRSYESSRERTPLVLVAEGISIPPAKADGAKDGWVVHSTDAEAGESVLKMQHLCSRQSLREREVAFRQFGRQELGEPVDYSDLINFAPLHQSVPEVVVASKQHERFCSESDAYTPGMRFYISLPSLMAQPNYVAFLGGHAICGSVQLDKVEHCIVTADDCGKNVAWTPKAFTETANTLFKKNISLGTAHYCRVASPKRPIK